MGADGASDPKQFADGRQGRLGRVRGGIMKQAQTTMPDQRHVANGIDRTENGVFRALSAAALVCLAGCGSRETTPGNEDRRATPDPTPHGDLLARVVPAPANLGHSPLSDRFRRVQDITRTRPSDLAMVDAFRTVRGLIDDAVRDTQSLEKPIGHLRSGYTNDDRGIQEQRLIIEAVARHSSRSVEQVVAVIEECHRGYLTTLGIDVQIKSLKQRLGLDEYARKRAELSEVCFESREEIAQATIRANLDKIDRSLELFRELRGLLQSQSRGAEHDAKRLKSLSRMCSAQTLSEVNEIIPQLEALRHRNTEGDFNLTLRKESERIQDAERRIRALDEALEARWCDDYDQMSLMKMELETLEARLLDSGGGSKRTLPTEFGQLVPSDKHIEFKADLAEIKLRDARLALYSIKDSAGAVIAKVLDTGREFDEHHDVRYVTVAIDEPSTRIALKRVDGGVRLVGTGGLFMQKQVLDIKETARSEVAQAFQPSFIQEGAVDDIRLLAQKVLMTIRMNPGCAFDMREASMATIPEVILRGPGIVYVGHEPMGQSLIRVKVEREDTMTGQGPLVISAPEGLSIGSIRHSAKSESDYTLSIGNAVFEQLGFRAEGKGFDVDVELKTAHGFERVPLVRNGACVLPRSP